MKIAITGSTGQIGKRLVEILDEHELLLLGRFGRKLIENFSDLENVSLYETNYTQESLVEILEPAEVLVHLAARPVRKDLPNIDDYYWIIRISENLFKVCSDLGIQNVIFVSSRMVYSPKVNKIPFLESEPVYPDNLYGVSKLTAENIGFYNKLNLKSLRLTEVRDFSERSGRLMMNFIKQALEKQPITVYGDGSGQREYLYVKDVALAIEAAIQKPAVKGVFNIGSGIGTTNKELAELVRDIFSEGESRIVYDQTKKEAPSKYPMDSTLARKVFGWKPKYSLKQALEDMKQENIAKGYNLVQKSSEIGMKLDDIDKESDLLGKSAGIGEG